MVRHVARKHGGLGIPVNGKWYSIKQPVSEVFVKDNKLSAFYGKQPSNDRELVESDMFIIIIMAELYGKEHYFYLYIGRILMSVREIVTVMFTTEE
jgi:hypothetical protein